jgi:hypothetical protein
MRIRKKVTMQSIVAIATVSIQCTVPMTVRARCMEEVNSESMVLPPENDRQIASIFTGKRLLPEGAAL